MIRRRIVILALACAAACVPAIGRAQDKGLNALGDDVVIDELARRNMGTLLERAFEQRGTPPAQRDAIRAIAALSRLSKEADRMPPAERRATVNKVVAGIRPVVPTMSNPRQLMQSADALIAAGVRSDVNTLEYWGPSLATQAQLRPVVETVIDLLDRADTLASAQVNRIAEAASANDAAAMRRLEEFENLSQLARQTRALANYHLALCLDPSNPRRAEVSGNAIEYLRQFDFEGNPARNNLRLVLGKLHATRNEFAEARQAFDSAISAPATPPEGVDAAEFAVQQRALAFEARYFRAVTEVMVRDARAARAKFGELVAWEKVNGLDADPSIATANQLLDYRILALDDSETSRARAAALLTGLLEQRPELEGQIMTQLRSTIRKDAPVAQLEPLLLRALISDAQDQVVRGQQESNYKPDAATVTQGLAAANELSSRQGKPGVDERLVQTARFLTPVFLEALDRRQEAAAGYVAFAAATKDTNAQLATAALTNAQRLFAQLGGLASEDPNVTGLYDQIVPLSLGPPFNQAELTYDWAYRLQQLGRPDEAVRFYRQVARTDRRYEASRYFLMVAMSQQLDRLKPGDPARASISGEIQSLADEVRRNSTKAMAGADEATQKTLRQRLARTTVLAAALARTELKDPQRALTLLENVEQSFRGVADERELLGEAMFTRVQANMELGKTDDAIAGLIQLLERSGGAQGAQIVFNMLSQLERDFGVAQAAGEGQRMASLQANRAALTPYLVQWAQKNASPEIRKFAYSYRVYDAETQRLAAEFVADPQQQAAKRAAALKLFEALDGEAGRREYLASRDPASPTSRLAYDPQVALGLARVRFAEGDWTRARDAFARLLADRAVGTAVITAVEGGQEKQLDNDAYWETTLRFIQSKLKAGDDAAPMRQLLREQYVRWGDRVGGTKWKADFDALRQELVPDFQPTTMP